jgi:hypothetical protein
MDGDDAIKALAEKVDAAVGAHAAGSVTITTVGANASASVTVNFPPGRFTAPPIVVVSVANTQSPNTASASAANPITADSFVCSAFRTTAGNAVVHWQATQV